MHKLSSRLSGEIFKKSLGKSLGKSSGISLEQTLRGLSKQTSRIGKSGLILALSLSLNLSFGWFIPKVEAAEKLVVNYRIFSHGIPVSELRHLADTGEASRAIQFYLRLANRNPQELQQILTDPVAVNGTDLYQILESPLGNIALDEVSQVIHSPNNLSNRESLKAALVGAALPDGQIRLIDVLEKYPTSEVHLNGERLVDVVQQINSFLNILR